jgi:hypothetical protein
MMPDPDDRSTSSDFELAEIVGWIGNCYWRRGLSPPSQLHRAISRCWLGLSRREIIDVLDKHFDDNLQLYHGSGDRSFYMVEAAISQALAAKHPRPVPERQPERPQRPRNRVVTLHNPSGVNDVYVEGASASLVREPESNVECPSGLGGYEAGGGR